MDFELKISLGTDSLNLDFALNLAIIWELLVIHTCDTSLIHYILRDTSPKEFDTFCIQIWTIPISSSTVYVEKKMFYFVCLRSIEIVFSP